MQFKSFMEALKGKQHKIDKNKNGQIDAHDFKLLRKEESEETAETIEESEERMARADYKVGASGRKSHKEIVFGDAESKDDEEEDKKEMKEAKMSDADMAERERIVKGMKKNLAGFKARYGERAKEVMYATATKQAMKEGYESPLDTPEQKKAREELKKTLLDIKKSNPKHPAVQDVKEETVEEAVQKADIPAYLRKQKGEKPLTMADVKAAPKDSISHPDNLAKARGAVKEEIEEIDEKSDQAKQNKTMKNLKAASIGAQLNRSFKLDPTEYGYKKPQHLNKAIGRAAMRAEATVPFDGPYTKTPATAKDKSGAVHSPMSRAKHLAKMAMKKQMKEDIDRLFEKDDSEYNYEGEMAVTQLKTISRHAEALQAKLQPDTNLPEWVQSKITLATDYMQTAHDYLMSELDEQAPVAPVPGQKFKDHAVMVNGKQRVVIPRKNMGNYSASEGWREVPPGTKMKEDFDSEGNLLESQISYTEFAMMLEYETKDGRYVHKGSYGGNYVDPEGADDADDKKPKQQPAEKRGRGRPAGAKSGARKITGTSKLFK